MVRTIYIYKSDVWFDEKIHIKLCINAVLTLLTPHHSSNSKLKMQAVAKGMLFVAHLSDGVKEAYVSHDTMFEGVVGHQHDSSFVTEDLFERMRTKLNLIAGSDGAKYTDEYPSNSEKMDSFLYSFMCRSCEEADGEVPLGVYSMKYIF